MGKRSQKSWMKGAALGLGAVVIGAFMFHPSASFLGMEQKAYAEAEELSAMDYLVEQWKNRVVEIDLTGWKVTSEDMSGISFRAQKLYPQLYYLGRYAYYQDSDGYITQLNMIYSANRDEEMEAEAAKVVALVDDSMSDLEKVLVVHDYICEDITYRENDTSSHHLLGSVINKQAVCEGYAEAYKFYLDHIGVPCKVVSGFADTATGVQGHAWNQVQIDGKWYFIDTTWDDLESQGHVRYDYFLRSGAVMSADHDWDEEYYETCDDTKYDNAFWIRHPSKIPMYAYGGSVFYMTYDGIYRHDLKTDNIRDDGSLFIPIEDAWKVYTGSIGYGYSDLAYKDGRLYYSTPKNVYSCKFDGTDKRVEMTLEDEDEQIWAIEISGGTLFYQTAAGLYDKRTTRAQVIDADYRKAKYPISIQSPTVEVSYGEQHVLNSYAPGKITYTSEHPEICTVDSNGILTAVSCGTSKIILQTDETELYLSGNAEIQVEVVPKDLSAGTSYLRLSDYSFTYNGKPQEPEVTVMADRGKEVPKDDYIVSYQNNVVPGTATVVVTGKGDKYTGVLKANFMIEKGSEPVTEPETESEKETETETEPETKETETETEPETKETETETEPETKETETETETETKETETETESGTKETETETESGTKETETETESGTKETETETESGTKETETEKGSETETKLPEIEGAEPETSQAILPVQVKKPAKVKGVSVKAAGKKKIKVRWKTAKECTGYRIEISTKRNFKRLVKAVNVKGQKKKAKMVSGLKSRTRYYIRVRAYKKVDGKVYYGAYSLVKRVRTK